MAVEAPAPANGVAKPVAPDLLPGPSNVARAQSRIRASRAQTLAALESGNTEEAPAKPAEESTPAEAPKPAPALEPEAPADEEADEVDEKPTDPAPAETDPESSKRLATIQTAEKRSREKIAKERAEVTRLRTELEQERQTMAAERAKERQEIEAFRKARERAKLDPVALLEAAGVDDLDYAAKVAYARSKAATDPAQREAAARMMREREHETELQSTKRRLEELEQKLTAKDQQAEQQRVVTAYLDHTVKSIGEDAPLTKALAAKNPAKLRAKLWETTQRLTDENDGDVPDYDEVVAAYETTRRDELIELGIDPATLSAAAPAKDAAADTKKNNQTADKKHPAKTLGNDLSTPRVPRPAKSDREHRAETLAMLESGKLE